MCLDWNADTHYVSQTHKTCLNVYSFLCAKHIVHCEKRKFLPFHLQNEFDFMTLKNSTVLENSGWIILAPFVGIVCVAWKSSWQKTFKIWSITILLLIGVCGKNKSVLLIWSQRHSINYMAASQKFAPVHVHPYYVCTPGIFHWCCCCYCYFYMLLLSV